MVSHFTNYLCLKFEIVDACSRDCFVLVQFSDADGAYTVMLLNFPFSDAHLYTVY
jgi:hypothetical protein